MNIYGAGMAGLLAANLFQTAEVFESGPADQQQHKALLRFRSPAIGDAVGIDFKKVTVHKAIWSGGRFVQPDIQLCNLYARKVVGTVVNRSIWNIDTVERWVAPENFLEHLAKRCGDRIHWKTPVTDLYPVGFRDPVVSTLPMPVMLKMAGMNQDMPEFRTSSIHVKRWRVRDCDVHQTIYFPDPDTNLYRASITGDVLMAEFVVAPERCDLFEAFGLTGDESSSMDIVDGPDCVLLDETKQRFGKILPIDDEFRKVTMFRLTHELNIYSLGRFATWRNILLDDVLKDIFVIKKMMASSVYDRVKVMSK